MSFEDYHHLAKVYVSPAPCQRIGKRTARSAVLCMHKSTIQVTILCSLCVLLQLDRYIIVSEKAYREIERPYSCHPLEYECF